MIFQGNLFSEILGMDAGVCIAAPDKREADAPYKVCYLLHGLCGDCTTWIYHTMLPTYASEGNTIYIMPEAGRSFYADMESGPAYFTYIAEELPEICKKIFRFSSDRADTAVIGGSMGGYGALKCALTYPERFGMCGALSSVCLFIGEELEKRKKHPEDPAFVQLYGEKALRDFEWIFGKKYAGSAQDDVLQLAQKVRDQKLKPRILSVCGTEDVLLESHRRFAGEMEKTGLDFCFLTQPGGHEYAYFDRALHTAIEYFGL